MKTKLLIFLFFCFGIFCGCSKEVEDIPIDIPEDVEGSVSGEIMYSGSYTGTNTTIYIRAYISNGNAIGEPDFSTSIAGAGAYSLDLGNYSGDLYLSAFMDVDNSGNNAGPTANTQLNNGVYGDPMACYGDYTFSGTGPDIIAINGDVANININLEDSGVLKINFSNTGSCTFGVINNELLNESFLHHKHFNVINSNDNFLLAVPAKAQWYGKVKFDNVSTAQLYAGSFAVSKNEITEISF